MERRPPARAVIAGGSSASHSARSASVDPRHGLSPAAALTGGFSWGFWVGFAIATTGVVATLTLIRRRDVQVDEAEPARAVA